MVLVLVSGLEPVPELGLEPVPELGLVLELEPV